MGGKSGKIAARNGKDVARNGTVDGKNGTIWRDVVVSTPPRTRLHVGEMGLGCACIRLLRCWRGWVAARSWN
jgi:hypothetical protein